MIKRFGLLLCVIAVLVFTGCRGGSSSGTNLNDTQPPSDVAGFGPTSVDDGTVTLGWTHSTDNVGISHYEITNVQLAQTVNTGYVNTYVWTGLTNGTPYNFQIVAVDAAGNGSATPALATGTPQEPDTTPPDEVSLPNGIGGWNNPVLKDFMFLSLSWNGSGSADLSHYLLSVSSTSGATWDILDSFDIGNTDLLDVPGPGPVLVADLLVASPYFQPGNPYTVRVIAVDSSANQSTGVQFDVIPTDSQDTNPPGPVENLAADPEDQGVALTWTEPLVFGPGDAASYEVYYRMLSLVSPNPGPLATDEDTIAWTSAGSTTATNMTVTGLTNGELYEFMVCAVDVSGNEHDGGATADRADDDAQNKITAIPTSDSILCGPNIRGGVFREGNFVGQDIIITVSTAQAGLLDTTVNTEIFYTLDGSQIDPANTANTATRGHFDFTSGNVTQIVANSLYAVTIDFDPSTGPVDPISANTLRPDGTADHIVLKYLIKGATDSSRVFRETYLIYPDQPGNTLLTEYLQFSGMRALRGSATATFVTAGTTAGDVIFAGGDVFGTALDSGERYRIAFEHFEDLQAQGGTSATMAVPRTSHQATLVNSGTRVLLTGGYNTVAGPAAGAANQSLSLNTYEHFETAAAQDGFLGAGPMDVARRFHTASRLYNGRVLLTGGLQGDQLHATYGAPWVTAFTDPTTTTIQHANEPLGGIGEVVEILTGGSGTVLQTAVLTNYSFDANLGVYNYTLDGLVTDITLGNSFRIITSGTADTEYFVAAGTPDGADGGLGDLNYARYGHSATMLQDGSVFLTGGLYDYRNNSNDDFEFTSEIFDPINETFELLDGSIELASLTRFYHQAVLLQDGKVLICGGLAKGDHVFKSTGFAGASIRSGASVFDPYSRSMKDVGSMTQARFMHSAALLPSGKVLVAGGFTQVDSNGVLVFNNTAEIYDPETETFSATGLMLAPRAECAISIIDDQTSPIYGQAVIGGGAFSQLAELYSESTGQFSATAHGVTGDRFIGSMATQLTDGNVLVTGGQTDEYFEAGGLVPGRFLRSAEVYDSSVVKFERTVGDMLDERRHHAATLLQDGTVLITGGENGDGGLTGAEIYDPLNKYFSQTADMLQPRYKHTATLLANGTVFVAGGSNLGSSLQSCEIFDPTSGIFTAAPSMTVGRYDHTATLLPNGWVLITGGEGIDSTSIEIFDSGSGLFLAAPPVTSLLQGRDGHLAVQPAYAIGKARFENLSATVNGSDGTQFGLANTDWAGAGVGVQVGDMIICLADNTPYEIGAVAANAITLTTPYTGVSTDEKLTGSPALANDQGFEDYVILSQDVYFAGGDVLQDNTEVFDSSAASMVAGVNLPNAVGRYGHAMTSFADMRLLITGGRYLTDGTYTSLAGVATDFDDDTWNAPVPLDSWEWIFHAAFRVTNHMIIAIRGHSAQAFFTE